MTTASAFNIFNLLFFTFVKKNCCFLLRVCVVIQRTDEERCPSDPNLLDHRTTIESDIRPIQLVSAAVAVGTNTCN